MTNSTASERRVNLPTHLKWVPLDKMRVAPEGQGQRELKPYRVNKMLAKGFNPDVMGYPEVSERDGHYWVIDGQARVEALKQWLGEGWRTQEVQCRVHVGLTLAEEAELFLLLNDFTAVPSLPKFRNAVNAGRAAQADIDRIIRARGFVVSRDATDNAIGCVATLERIYDRAGGVVLGRAVSMSGRAYGKSGLEAPVIDGLALLCQRYNGELDDETAVAKLSSALGGVNGLLGNAEKLRRATGNQRNDCVAAAAVEIINRGKGGKKLPSWWA